MNLKLSLVCICTAFTLGMSASANADYIKVDYLEVGDAANFVDTDTNTEWLNLDATRGLSYDEVVELTQAGGELEGWSFVDYWDLVDLYYDILGVNTMVTIGIDNITSWTVSRSSWSESIDYFNELFGNEDGLLENFGFNLWEEDLTVSGIYYEEVDGVVEATFKTAISWYYDYSTSMVDSSTGTFLIRDYVPLSVSTADTTESSSDEIVLENPEYTGDSDTDWASTSGTSGASGGGGTVDIVGTSTGDALDVPAPLAFGALGLGLLGFTRRRTAV